MPATTTTTTNNHKNNNSSNNNYKLLDISNIYISYKLSK